MEPFKLHHNGTPTAEVNWAPSGALIFHNTIVRKGVPWLVWSRRPGLQLRLAQQPVRRAPTGDYACEFTCEMVDCDFDYDGFAGMLEPGAPPAGADGRRSRSSSAGTAPATTRSPTSKAHAPVETPRRPARQRLGLRLGPAARRATRTALPQHDAGHPPRSPPPGAVDAGESLPGLNDGFKGKAPDLGAFELGDEPPHYGPRPE